MGGKIIDIVIESSDPWGLEIVEKSHFYDEAIHLLVGSEYM